ncbi:hypothetical protein BD779DRAFT_1405579, partial [Infundibulicybe gibba]
CALCLSRVVHDIAKCKSTTLWNGEPARCYRGDRGRIYNSSTRAVICLNWQLVKGCSDTTHDSRHECSGCGSRNHGAQECHLA